MDSAGRKVTPEFRLGDRVEIKLSNGLQGSIIELRGPLGPGGASIYRLLISGFTRKTYIEVRGDQLVLIPAPVEVK